MTEQLYYREKGYAIGDIMPFEKDRVYYLFQLRDERGEGPITTPFGWALTTTRDFVHYKDCGTVIPHGTENEHDYFLFSGSVFEDRNGLYHAFYTGYNPNFIGTDRPSQITMHAESRDLLHWTKTGIVESLKPQPGYNPDDWRDPFVMWDEEQEEYKLFLGARDCQSGNALNGCTVYFTSKDLKEFQFGGKLYSPGMYTMHEMPDIFRIGDWWYLIISEYSDRNRTVYRMSRSLQGPWLIPEDDCFDGRAYYAARTFGRAGKRILYGWVPTRKEDQDTGEFEWGGTFVPHEVIQRADGTLGVRPLIEAVEDELHYVSPLNDVKLDRPDGLIVKTLEDEYNFIPGAYMLTGNICFESSGTAFIRFRADGKTGEGYQYVLSLREQRIWFEKSPNSPWGQVKNLGLDRVFHFEKNVKYRIRLIVDATVSVLYVNDVALSARVCGEYGTKIQAGSIGGRVYLSGMYISN